MWNEVGYRAKGVHKVSHLALGKHALGLTVITQKRLSFCVAHSSEGLNPAALAAALALLAIDQALL